jgi:HAD superfamily hydrolase (TIGR01484 family)
MADPFEADKAYTDSFNLAVLEKAGVSEAVMDYIKSNRVILDSVPDYYTKARPHINKITMNFALDEEGRPVGKEEVLRYIGSRSDITAVTGGANNIEVTSVRATKGGAVRFLAERLGADMGDIMCIGDSENDISMLKAAGTGVCMKNSDAKVIAAADFVADSNEEDGAAKAILKYTGGEEICI